MIYKDYAYEKYPYLDTLNESYTLLPEKTIVANYEFNNEEGSQEEDRYQLKSQFFSLEQFKNLEDELSKTALTLNRIEVRRGDIKIKFFDENKEEIINKIVSAEEIKTAWSAYDKNEGLTLAQEILLLRFEQVKNKKQILYRKQINITIEDLLYKGYTAINTDGETYSPPLKTLREAKYFQIIATYNMEDGCAAAAFTVPRLTPAAKTKDIKFLTMIDETPIKEQFVRILLLEQSDQIQGSGDNPICLEGYVTSGSINVNGSSAIRRTGSLQMVVTEDTKNILSKDNLININTRFALEVGFNNPTYFYSENPIIWLPQGIFVVTGCSIKEDARSLTLSVNFKDKSAYLNGEMGGVFPAALDLNTKEIINAEGKLETKDILIKEIVEGMLSIYGGLTANEMHISIPTVAIQALGWKGKQDAYLIEGKELDASNSTAIVTLDYNEAITYKNSWTDATLKVISYGDNMGWRYTHFTYPQKELKANPGDNIISILNKITSFFKNYEFFFDVFGIFQFREKNDSVMDNLEIQYEYKFIGDHSGVISYNNSPQYLNVKNDYVVWGEQTTTNGNKRAIQYHLAFDKNPPMLKSEWSNIWRPVLETKTWDVQELIKIPDKTVKIVYSGNFQISDKTEQNLCCYLWGRSNEEYQIMNTNIVSRGGSIASFKDYSFDFESTYGYLYFCGSDFLAPTAWIQIDGTFYDEKGNSLGTFSQNVKNCRLVQPAHEFEAILLYGPKNNYYYPELQVQLPLMVNLSSSTEIRRDAWEALEIDHSNANYWLDLIDISTLSSDMLLDVHDIGRRTIVFSNIGVNCVEEPADIVPYLLNITGEEFDDVEQHALVLNVDKKLEEGFYSGGMMSGAAEYIRSVLQNYITFNESISLITNPIYYLEPNTVVRVEREDVGISGDFTINTFNIPLDTKSQMTLQLKKNLEMLTQTTPEQETVIGTWVLPYNPLTLPLGTYNLNFTAKGENFQSIIRREVVNNYQELAYNNNTVYTTETNGEGEWAQGEEYRTITITDDVNTNKIFKDWLKTNATKVN